MRELTLKGFLTQYVKKLSFSNTLNMKLLSVEAMSINPRLQAPLVLYAVVTDKTHQLKKCLSESGTTEEMLKELSSLSQDHLEIQLQSMDLPEEYRKVWNSFLVAHNAPLRDEELKSAMREKILRLQKTNSCSNYRIYADLKLNPGNINSWLKDGESRKVSYQTAQKILEYILNYQNKEIV